MDRAAHAFHAGAEITTENIYSFFLGFAKRILLEHHRKVRRSSDTWPAGADPVPENRIEALLECLAKIGQSERYLVETYYGVHAPGGKLKSVRAGLAREAGLTPNALRLRAFRVRSKLYRLLLESDRTAAQADPKTA